MKTNPFPLLLSAIIFATSLGAFAQEKAAAPPIYVKASDTKELMSKDGQKVIVYGTTSGSGKSGSGMNFVNFDGAEFYLVTFKSDLTEFLQGEPADLYDGKRLAVTGVISIYKEKPQIKLTDPKMVQILEADTEFPPKADAEPAKKKPAPEAKKTETPETKPTPEEPKKKPPVDPKKYFK